MPSELFLAWLAGYIDGQGSYTLIPQVSTTGSTTYYPRLRLKDTDRPALDEILATLGVGSVRGWKSDNPHHQPVFAYTVYGKGVVALAAQVAPYSRSTRERAALIAAFPYDGPENVMQAQRAAIYEQVRALSSRRSRADDEAMRDEG